MNRFDPGAEQGDAAGQAIVSVGAEIELVGPSKPRPAVAAAGDSQAYQRHRVVEKLVALTPARRAAHSDSLFARAEGVAPEKQHGCDDGEQQKQILLSEPHFFSIRGLCGEHDYDQGRGHH